MPAIGRTAHDDPLYLLIAHLVASIDEAFDRRSWHGTTLRGALRGVTASQAAWRPAPARHNVWEVAVHAAYWKYVVRRRLGGDRRGSFPLPGSNWFARGAGSEADWQRDLRVLGDAHRRLREVVAALAPEAVNRPIGAGQVTPGWLVRGIVAHDLYHAGQIQLLKRLRPRGQ